VHEAFAAGASDHLAKPLDLPLLRQRVSFVLRLQRVSEDLRRALADLHRNQHLLAESQRRAGLGFWEWDPDGDVLALSAEACALLAVAPGEVTSRSTYLEQLVHPDDRGALEKTMDTTLTAREGSDFDVRIIDGASRKRFLHHYLERVEDVPGAGARVLATIQDVTERRHTEERIRKLAFYDALTGLPNRRLLEERITAALAHRRDTGGTLALLFVDIDRFKRVNDSLGHLHGDRLLKEVAQRLVRGIRPTDAVLDGRRIQSFVSRFAGDEFIVVLSAIPNPRDAGRVARRLLDALRAPIELGGKTISISASVGIVCAPADGDTGEELLRKADAAMYAAKQRGRDAFEFYDAASNASAERRLQLESQLRRALAEGGLRLHYQPQIDAASQHVRAYEALIRWPLASGEWVPALELIATAEECGLIGAVGEWVLKEACAQLARWRAQGRTSARVAVNVSVKQLHPEFVECVKRTLAANGLPANALELEVTESAFIDPKGEAGRVLETLAGIGVEIAIDDFGTGYSSFSYLGRLPVHALKIDGSLVAQIGGNGAIVGALIALGRHLGLRVVAEGVEREDQERFLASFGDVLLQGYLFGRPAPADEL
jgi:diguanylate cyclase (GGDEF)-like protein/PAS domain S-box-containing protein